jgi:DNA-binding response OmpR family regulator
MLTSRGEAPEASGLPPGAADSITKPLDAFELLSKVRGHIGT